jgi:hypothetical protein
VPKVFPVAGTCNPGKFDIDAIPDALEEILKRVLEIYEVYGVAPPKRHIWTVGDQPGDCDQLMVLMTSLSRDPSEGNCVGPVRMSVQVSVTRCVPIAAGRTGTSPPTPAQLADVGKRLGRDAWILARSACFLDLYQMGDLEDVVEIAEAQGGMQTVVLSLSIVI